ncbi:MAG: hypothetical protein BJ554DRAFT_5869, partial [Olpidium bornovanus]
MSPRATSTTPSMSSRAAVSGEKAEVREEHAQASRRFPTFSRTAVSGDDNCTAARLNVYSSPTSGLCKELQVGFEIELRSGRDAIYVRRRRAEGKSTAKPSFDVASVDAVRPVPSRAVTTRGSEFLRA